MARQSSFSAALRTKTGGSGGDRTRHKSNKYKGETGVPSQGASQEIAELKEVASAWPHLSSRVNAKLFAISEAIIRDESGVAVRRDRQRRFGEWQRRFRHAEIGSAQSLLV
jgi:hypothetical protein